ncbi:MAG: hypothetical protein EZS28_027859 [Streblomastix strix]|uniref:Tyr recombinase domain-containing protein n=1 Tax=Streblomastix strix TaxID=222440 RepID=A0A5J4V287_9EUKA|nr:MAG: hypothetical protein EZS28_027859 [Streblomastix strix]
MRKGMALLVAISGARMMELAVIQRKDIEDSEQKITVKKTIKQGKKPRTRKFILRTRDRPRCSVNAISEWLQNGECKQRFEEKIQLDYYKKRELGRIVCSRELMKIRNQAEVDRYYTGLQCETCYDDEAKRRSSFDGEMKVLIGHAPGSVTMDVLYRSVMKPARGPNRKL